MRTDRTVPAGTGGRVAALADGPRRALARRLPHPLYRFYRKRRVAWEIKRFAPRVVCHTYVGHPLNVLLADPLSAGWYDCDWAAAPEIDELVRVGALAPGATVFDVGAHQAVVALVLAREVGPLGRVVAVEAEPHNAAVARRNVELNEVENVTVIHSAIADRPGSVYFAESLNGHIDQATRVGNVEVSAVTIDQLAGQHGRPDLVFVDVEGYEGKALEGATETLRSGRTSFFVEVHAGELVDCRAEDVIAHFDGYVLSVAPSLPNGAAGAFAPLDDPPHGERFFLIATPALDSVPSAPA